MDYMNNLNDKQKEAALCTEGPLLILAGAGSGKTSTMTHRIAYLMREKGVLPGEIFAVTFTNKAAGEMRSRVEALVGSVQGMWILTFHSACLRILRRESDLIGYSKDFTVYDPTDQKAVMRRCLKDRNLDDKKLTPAFVLNAISKCKEKDISPNQFRRDNGGVYPNDQVADLYEDYEAVLKKNNAMDFDDLLRNTVHLFARHKEVLAKYQGKFTYIMVDEYQDTNYIQYRIIKMLAEKHGNLCVVGDDDQCIYQWRGADIKNILSFEKDFSGAKVIKLEQNYRSHGNILAGAHSVIANNQGRKIKKLWTDKESGEKIKYYRGDDEKDEARFVASEISRITKSPSTKDDYAYKDFVVLYRTNAQSRTFEEAFIRKEIPYRILGNTRYYDRKEIKDMMAYMRLILNPNDDLALARIINEPKRGIGEKTLEKIQALALVHNQSLLKTLNDVDNLELLPGKARKSVGEMVELLMELHEEEENLRIIDIYDRLLFGTGYLQSLEGDNTVEAEGRLENVLEFKSVINQYEKEEAEPSLPGFLEKISLMAEVDNLDAKEDAVILMTLHSAKGLEFPVVFMVGMEDGLFPGWRSFDEKDKLEEERRLCYVGMTRAQNKLYLINAEVRTLYGKTDFTKESMFLKEIDPNVIEGDGIYRQKKEEEHKSRDGFSKDAYRPFDGLKYSRAQSMESGLGTKLTSKDLASGDLVLHSKFGKGTVLDVEGPTVTVVFDSVGTKKLAISIAPLEKI
jgi:DNA helicase-2/ATP-dependent DNA helicase PcrA